MGSEDAIAESCRARLAEHDNKQLSHTALVINNVTGTEGYELVEQIATIVNWLILTQASNSKSATVTVFDKAGLIEKQAEVLAANLRQLVMKEPPQECHHEVLLRRAGQAVCVHCLNCQRCSQLVPLTAVEEECPHSCIDIDSQKDKTPTRVILRKAQLMPELESTPPVQLALVFNSAKSILKLDGFPALLKESCEIIECGRLADFSVVNFVQAIEKFSHTEQRWGS